MASSRTDGDSVPILQFLFDHGDTRVNDTWLEHQTEICPWWGFDNAAPLHHAARVGNIKAVRWLLDRGADPTRLSKRILGGGTTPIDSAAFMKHTDIEELLLQATENMYGIRDVPVLVPLPPKGLDEPRLKIFLENSAEMGNIPQGNGEGNGGAGGAQQDYSMFLMFLEQSNKKTIQLERADSNIPDERQSFEIFGDGTDEHLEGFNFDASLRETEGTISEE
ncbi:MAG: hypothetical protein Q9170_002772 [Blastenia crenularia]